MALRTEYMFSHSSLVSGWEVGTTYRVLDLVGLVTSGILGSLSTGADACVAVLGNVCQTLVRYCT